MVNPEWWEKAKALNLVRFVRTRWTSRSAALERVVLLCEELKTYAADKLDAAGNNAKDKGVAKKLSRTHEDWKDMQQVEALLFKMKLLTKFVQTEKTPTSSYVHLKLHALKQQLDESNSVELPFAAMDLKTRERTVNIKLKDMDTMAKKAAERLAEALDERLPLAANTEAMAMVLDPRFFRVRALLKKDGDSEYSTWAQGVDAVEEAVKDQVILREDAESKKQAAAAGQERPRKRARLSAAAQLCGMQEEEEEEGKDNDAGTDTRSQLEQYLSLPNIFKGYDVFDLEEVRLLEVPAPVYDKDGKRVGAPSGVRRSTNPIAYWQQPQVSSYLPPLPSTPLPSPPTSIQYTEINADSTGLARSCQGCSDGACLPCSEQLLRANFLKHWAIELWDEIERRARHVGSDDGEPLQRVIREGARARARKDP